MLFLLFTAGCAGSIPESLPDGFVRVQGTKFMLNGSLYYFAGTNLWFGSYLASTGPTGDPARLRRELDTLGALGITNLRILACSEDSYLPNSLKPAVQTHPGRYDENLLIGLDVLLDEMRRRGMKAVVFLSNYWEWSGGFAQYVTWGDGREQGLNPEDPSQGGWTAFMNYSASFYAHSAGQRMYRDLIRKIVLRTNTVNGIVYRDDPTIMSWQLANEPRPGAVDRQGEENLASFNAWIDSTARFIKSLDPNHLVSTGSEGSVGTLLNEQYYLDAHRSPSVDYLTFHLWAYNWRWFDPKRIAETIDSAETKAKDYINRHIALARILGKPVTMEEFGLARDSLACEPGSPVTARNRYFRTVLGLVADSAEGGAPIAGTNFWAWGGEDVARRPDFRWRAGDTFLGDPPHEAQGLNSVFNADVETKEILSAHSRRIRSLGE